MSRTLDQPRPDARLPGGRDGAGLPARRARLRPAVHDPDDEELGAFLEHTPGEPDFTIEDLDGIIGDARVYRITTGTE
jgi:hypothetical protein